MGKKFVLTALILITLACGSSDGGQAEERPPPKPTEDLTIIYQTDLSNQSALCSTALNAFSQVSMMAAEDITVIFDPQWTDNMEFRLKLIDDYCATMGWRSNVPAIYSNSNELILQAAGEYRQVTRLYREGMANFDAEKIEQATTHMTNASGLVFRATELLPQ